MKVCLCLNCMYKGSCESLDKDMVMEAYQCDDYAPQATFIGSLFGQSAGDSEKKTVTMGEVIREGAEAIRAERREFLQRIEDLEYEKAALEEQVKILNGLVSELSYKNNLLEKARYKLQLDYEEISRKMVHYRDIYLTQVRK